MAGKLLSLRLLSVVNVVTVAVIADPAPGRIPKVYNALITSNQNLEPSKAYPVYQPVIHDSFAFSLQPGFLYPGEFPLGNSLLPPQGLLPREPQPSEVPPAGSTEAPATETPEADPPSTPEPNIPPNQKSEAPEDSSTAAPPPPPNTESPITLNQFGLPTQVLPLGRFNPAYNGFTHIGPFTYSYPSVRYYDPFDPFSLGPYGFPFYRPLPNALGPSVPLIPARIPEAPALAPAPPAPAAQPSQPPPSEPSDLNVLNYSSKDPAIPNVPPPPLPQGGLKSDKSE